MILLGEEMPGDWFPGISSIGGNLAPEPGVTEWGLGDDDPAVPFLSSP
jgi:hypothetical protein